MLTFISLLFYLFIPYLSLDLIDYGDSNGDTALMHAVLSKHVECLKILLEAGSKTEMKDLQGRTALLLSAAKVCCASV